MNWTMESLSTTFLVRHLSLCRQNILIRAFKHLKPLPIHNHKELSLTLLTRVHWIQRMRRAGKGEKKRTQGEGGSSERNIELRTLIEAIEQ